MTDLTCNCAGMPRRDFLQLGIGAVLGLGFSDILRLRANAALQVLAGQKEVDVSKLAAIGYCFGGTTALEIGRSGGDVKAIVGFHSGLGTTRPAESGVVRARILTCIGFHDPIIPPEQRL